MIKIGGRGLGKTRKIIEDLERKNKDLEGGIKYWRNHALTSDRIIIEKNNKTFELERINSSLEGLNRKLINEKKELINSIEKMKFDNDMLNHYISSLKNTIKMRNNEIEQLKYLNNFFSIVIKENFNNEDSVIKHYLDEKLNLLIDQNAPECLKTLIQDLIDELNNN